MKTILVLALAASAALCLTACASQNVDHVLGNLSECTRDYKGTVNAGMTGGAISGDVAVHCEPLSKQSSAAPAR